jgi:hypothetical protein
VSENNEWTRDGQIGECQRGEGGPGRLHSGVNAAMMAFAEFISGHQVVEHDGFVIVVS